MGGNLRQFQLDGLEIGDGLAESLALGRVGKRGVPGSLRDSHAAGSDVQPTDLQTGEYLLHASTLDTTQQGAGWHDDVIEDNLTGFSSLVTQLAHVLADREALE